MLFPALGLTAAMWLMMTPLLGVEDGFRAGLAVTAGIVAAILLPLSVWSRKAGAAAAGVGIVLGFANFVLDAPIGSYASLATCAVTLMLGGLGPWPVTEARTVVALPAPASNRANDREARLPAAA